VPRDGRADVRPVAVRPYSDDPTDTVRRRARGRHANRRLRSPANLLAVPTLKHPEQEEKAEGGVPVTVLEDAPLDFRARACNNRLGVRRGRRTGVRWADSGTHRSHAGGYEQYAHDGEDYSDAKEPHLFSLQVERP